MQFEHLAARLLPKDREQVDTLKREWKVLQAGLERKLRQLKKDDKEMVIVIGGKSRLISKLLLTDVLGQLESDDWLAKAIANTVRLGHAENKNSYLNHFGNSADDLPHIERVLRQHTEQELQFVFVDDYGSSYGKANGTVNRMTQDMRIQTDFILLTADTQQKPSKENASHIHTLNSDKNVYSAMRLLSELLSGYISQKM